MLSPTTRTRREAGFTLMELVIGMILAVLVLGAVMLAMTSLFKGASESSVDRKAAARASDALERFERDVRSAESPERLNSPIIRDEMRAIALWGVSKGANGTVSAITWNNPCATTTERAKDYCLFQDITVSHANQLWFRADVDATNAGYECVAWVIQPSGALRRIVRSNHRRCYTNDFGPVLSNEVVLDAPAIGTLGNAQGRSASFGFLVRFNRQGLPQASYNGPTRYNNPNLDPANCQTFTYFPLTTNLIDMRRGFITNVTLDLSAWTTGGDATGTTAKSSARQRLTSSATIMSRSTDDFAYATGCGQ